MYLRYFFIFLNNPGRQRVPTPRGGFPIPPVAARHGVARPQVPNQRAGFASCREDFEIGLIIVIVRKFNMMVRTRTFGPSNLVWHLASQLSSSPQGPTFKLRRSTLGLKCPVSKRSLEFVRSTAERSHGAASRGRCTSRTTAAAAAPPSIPAPAAPALVSPRAPLVVRFSSRRPRAPP